MAALQATLQSMAEQGEADAASLRAYAAIAAGFNCLFVFNYDNSLIILTISMRVLIKSIVFCLLMLIISSC